MACLHAAALPQCADPPSTLLTSRPALMAGRPRPPPLAVAPMHDLAASSLKSPTIFPSDYIEWSVEPLTRGRNLQQEEEEDQEDDENDEKEASTRTAQVKDEGEAAPLPQRRPSVLGSESLASVFEVAPRGGERAGLVRCLLVRNRRLGPLGATEYRLYLQGAKAPGGLSTKLDGDRLMLVATAQAAGAFHIFNLARGGVSGTLTRKSGNFVGEFVRVSAPRSPVGGLGLLRAAAFVLRGNVAHTELAAAAFHKPSLSRHVHDGPRPRNLHILLPGLDARRRPAVVTSNDDPCAGGVGLSLLERLHDRVASGFDVSSPWAGFRPATSKKAAGPESSGPRLLEVKAPAFDGTAYRLDFDGRATVPSVKNMQLVDPSERSDVVLQLGKVSANEFHLDFKGPFNALQALAVALAQFYY